MPKRGLQRFAIKNYLSPSIEKPGKENLLCFTKLQVSENVEGKRGGGCDDLPSKMFCRTLPNVFVEEPFCVSKSFGYRKVFCTRGEITNFYRNLVVSQYRKNSYGFLPCFTKILVSKKFMDNKGGEEGVSRFSVESFLPRITEKHRKQTLQCVTKIGRPKS